jgi:hypothetical protein
MEKKLNDAAKTYQQMQKKDWSIGSKKERDEFSQGAQKPGHLVDPGVSKKLQGVWKALTK